MVNGFYYFYSVSDWSFAFCTLFLKGADKLGPVCSRSVENLTLRVQTIETAEMVNSREVT